MAHNRDRHPVYPTEKGIVKQPKKQGKWWKWALFWVVLATPMLCLLVPDIVDDCRLHRSNIKTTAYIKELYKSGKGHNIKCVSYTYCINGEWYNGHTSPPDSIWDNIQPGDPFEIVYEKGNPSNSNWVGYYKK